MSIKDAAPWKQRLIIEHADLNDRLIKLNAFLLTPAVNDLPELDKDMLHVQRSLMVAYLGVLTMRINRVMESTDDRRT